MTQTVKIYGASDGLIEVVGALNEEFNAYGADEEPVLLAFSDGTVLRVTYGENNEAFWRISWIAFGTAEYEHIPATDEASDYSDRVTLRGEFAWCVCGKGIVRAKAGARCGAGMANPAWHDCPKQPAHPTTED